MHVLFLHKNFPAQFRYIAPRLVRDYGWRCTFFTEQQKYSLPGVEKLLYESRGGATMANHDCTRNFENSVAEALSVYEALKAHPQLDPDLIIAHTGFGSSLYLPYLYDAPIINFLEYYYSPVEGEIGYRSERPVSESQLLRLRTRNAMLMLDIDNCTRGWTPTRYQRDYFPPEWRQKIEVIFDGIDTSIYHRREDARARLARELEIPPDARIVTYAARGFEFMRGFDIFMRAAKRIYELYPNVVFVAVGKDSVHYGDDQSYTGGKSLREHIFSTEQFDLSKFRFPGFVPEDRLADIFSLGDVHIYLTQPFIASWSMVCAMGCGAVLLASDQKCVREYVVPGENGLLVDFFDVDGLAQQAVEVLRDPPAYRSLSEAARQTVAERFSVDVAMPKLVEFYERIAPQRREPSHLASRLIREGVPGMIADDEDEELREFGAAPPRLTEPPPDDVSRTAVRQLRAATDDVSVDKLAAACQQFRGPAPWFAQVGPWNHPLDLTRMFSRAREWTPRTIVDIGDSGGGRTLLWTRAATDDARIIVAGVAGQTPPEMKMSFFNGLARKQQTVRCVTKAETQHEICKRVAELLSRRLVDIVFLDGWRPVADILADFEFYSRLVRKGGIIGWDGIGGPTPPPLQHAGGYLLWQRLKPKFPRNAEYLSGIRLPRRGIGLMVLN